MTNKKLQNLIKISLLSVMAFILTFLSIRLPMFPEFLKIDISEVPVLVGAFMFGPVAGIVIEVIKNFLGFLFSNSGTGGIGEIANLLIGCSLVVPSSIYYRSKIKKLKEKVQSGKIDKDKEKRKKNFHINISMVIGVFSMIIIASLLNYFILLPLYIKLFLGLDNLLAPFAAINSNIKSLFTAIIFSIVPFNLVKGSISFLIFKIMSLRIENIVK